MADTAVPDQQAIASKLVSAKPLDQPQAPSSATSPQPHIAPPLDQHDAQAATALQEDAAPPVDQEDLLEVRSRLQNLLQDVPFQDALDAVSAQMPMSPPQASTPSAQGPGTAVAAATAATAVDKQPSPGQRLSHALGDPAKAQSDSGLATAASIPEGQAVPAASADPSRDIGDRKRSTATAAPGLKKRKRAAAQVAAHATAVDTAAAAVADENSGESPVEKQKTGTANDWPSLVQVVCNGMRGMFDAAYTMVMPSTGKRCRPSVFVQSAGMGHVGKWQEIIRVDDGEGVPGIAIGHWLKEAKRNGLKRTGGRPQAAKATAASPKEADPLDVAISAYPEASPSGQQQANVKSPAGSERATDAETSPNKKAAESQAGTKNLFKHVSDSVGLKCVLSLQNMQSAHCCILQPCLCGCIDHLTMDVGISGSSSTPSMMCVCCLYRTQPANQAMLALFVCMSVHQYVCLCVNPSTRHVCLSDSVSHQVPCCLSLCVYIHGR